MTPNSFAYNDLLELQRLYAARHGQENPAIARLLQVKLTSDE